MVVLPAPLGPMSPTVSPALIVIDTSSTARTPPKDFRKPVARSSTVPAGRRLGVGNGRFRISAAARPTAPSPVGEAPAYAASTSTPLRRAISRMITFRIGSTT